MSDTISSRGLAAAGETGRGVAVAGDVINSIIITGDGNVVTLHSDEAGVRLQSTTAAGPARRALQPSERWLPTRLGNHVDRDGEVHTLLHKASPGHPVNVYGEAGIGKTYVLLHAVQQAVADLPDGVVFVNGDGLGRHELLLEVFGEFYDYDGNVVVAERQIRRELRDKRALVFIDGCDLTDEDVQQLVLAAPQCTIVVASQARALWVGEAMPLTGLELAYGLAVVEQELGRPLEDGERAHAEALCHAVRGHPRRLREATAMSRLDGTPLAGVADVVAGEDSAESLANARVAALSPEARSALLVLATVGAPVAEEHLSQLTSVSGPLLADLQARGHVRKGETTYEAVGDVKDHPPEAVTAGVVAHFVDWAESKRNNPSELLVNAPAILQVLRLASSRDQHDDVVRLGQTISAALVLGRRWDAWGEASNAVLTAARLTQDRSSEAWALHQRGSRAWCLGETTAGRRDLKEALRIRRSLGESRAAEVTRGNLRLTRRVRPRIMRLAILAAIAALVGVGALLWPLGEDAPNIVSVTMTGLGSVVSEPPGVNCGPVCRASFADGAEVTLTAAAEAGSVFAGWQGACEGLSPCVLTVDDDVSVSAGFQPADVTWMVQAATRGGGGRVVSEPSGINCGPVCRASFADGAEVTLTAVADEGYQFAGWAGGCSGTQARCTLRLGDDTEFTARFTRLEEPDRSSEGPNSSPEEPDRSPEEPDFSPQEPDFSPEEPDFSPQGSDFSPQESDFSPQEPDFYGEVLPQYLGAGEGEVNPAGETAPVGTDWNRVAANRDVAVAESQLAYTGLDLAAGLFVALGLIGGGVTAVRLARGRGRRQEQPTSPDLQ